MSATYSIGDLARATGVKPTTIRWYEQEGWLPKPSRTEGGHRAYGAAHLRRLGFIRHARELGFESEAIRALLDLADRPDADCGQAHALATAQIVEIDARLLRQEGGASAPRNGAGWDDGWDECPPKPNFVVKSKRWRK